MELTEESNTPPVCNSRGVVAEQQQTQPQDAALRVCVVMTEACSRRHRVQSSPSPTTATATAMLDSALSRSPEEKLNKRELYFEHSFHVGCVLLDGSTPAKAPVEVSC